LRWPGHPPIDEKALGPDHPDVATNLNNLAKLLYTQGNYAAAEPLYRRALAIDEKALGPNHPTVAWYLNNRALLFKAKGDYAAAELLCRRALAIDDKALGPDHPTTRQIKKNLDDLLQKSAQATAPKPKN
jgi:tetratricopeptide (TPR) repeat protein